MIKLTSLLKTTVLLLLLGTFFSFDLPTGWYTAGSHPESYEMGIDKGSGQDGKNAATIKSISKKITGYGTLMQYSKPDQFLGKRVRMTGFVKSEITRGWSGLWFRVDQAGTNVPLSFDNMQERSIMGTTGWTKYEIVLDVPANASNIAYGALLSGMGQIWFDQISFEIVDTSILVTSLAGPRQTPRQNEPTNLDFEK